MPIPFPATLRPAVRTPGKAENGGTRETAVLATDVLCLPNPDWLKHRLLVSGPVAILADFQAAAAGPGVIPWRQNAADLAAGWFDRMMAVPAAQRGLSVTGAHALADRLRDAIEARLHFTSPEARGVPVCPLDLNALVPPPEDILARGPDDPATIAWLWEHWGTTWPLRHVSVRSDVRAGSTRGTLTFRFHAADWSPCPAFRAIRELRPELRFVLQAEYETEFVPQPRQADQLLPS